MVRTKNSGKKSRRARDKLTAKAIEQHVGARSFRLGQDYFESGAIFDGRRQGELLKARCQGQSADSYALTVRVEGNRILEAECSCPVGDGGYCKHVAALLLTWLYAPEEFRETEPLEKRLAGCSTSQLIALVEQMVEREPDLESWLELALPTATSSDAVVKPDAYRRQTVAAFANAGYGWEADRELTASLESLQKIGDQFKSQKNFASAASVYTGILDGFISEFETFQDETGNVVSVACECITSLGDCLPHLAEESESRASAVHSLFDVLRFDIDFGGIGLSDDVPDILSKHATSAERAVLAHQIRDEIPRGDDFSSKWKREAWGGLLLEFAGEPEDDEAFLKRCRDFGLTGALIERLLELGRLDEALQEIRAASDYEAMGHADRLMAHGHADVAHSLVQDRLSTNTNGPNNWQLRDWLKRFYESRKDWQSVLDLWMEDFRSQPNLSSYLEIRKRAKKLKTWDSLRPKLMANVPTESPERIRIHLEEGEVSEAIELLESRPKKRPSFSLGWDRVDLEVAKAAEASYPETALKIYKAEAEKLIAERGRGNYQAACGYLKKVKNLFKTTRRTNEWTAYIKALREENRTLRAFQDELSQSGL